VESDHCIFRNETARKFSFEGEFHFFPEQEARIAHAVAHLDKVLKRQVGYGVGIRFARALKFRKYLRPIRTMVIEKLRSMKVGEANSDTTT